MHPRIAEVLEFIDNHRANLLAVVRLVPETVAARRPSRDRWSVAQVVAHLGLVESSIAALFRHRLNEAKAAGLGQERETSPVIPTIDVVRLLDRERTLVAGERSRPPEAPSLVDGLATLERTRRIVKEAVARGDGLALGDVAVPHPLLGSLNLYQWLIFLGAHEARHTAQIREVTAIVTSGDEGSFA